MAEEGEDDLNYDLGPFHDVPVHGTTEERGVDGGGHSRYMPCPTGEQQSGRLDDTS